jgi:hypothetical protein
MVTEVPHGSLCMAFLDPYNLEHLSFSIILVQDFLVEDRPISPLVEDHLTVSLAEPKATSLTLPFPAGKFASFDAPIALASDLDFEGAVMEAVPDRIWSGAQGWQSRSRSIQRSGACVTLTNSSGPTSMRPCRWRKSPVKPV